MLNNMEKPSILVVDDEQINFVLLNAILGKLGYSVKYAENGYKAIEMARENDFKLIIMDIKMPIMNGVETSRQIKAIKPQTNIIASSAIKALDDEEYSLFCNFISKPINRAQLIELVEKYTK